MANAPHKFKTGVAVTGTATVNADTVTTNAAAQTLTNKTIDGSNNTISNIPASALPSNIDASKIADGSVSNAEFQYISTLTSDAQTQLNAKAVSATLASTANGDGASLIGIEDSAAQFTATNVEGALTESLDAAQAAQSTADAALPKAGGTMSGAIAMGTSKITGLGDGTAAQDAATKGQLDAVEALVNGLEFQQSALDFVTDNTAVPASEVTGDRYILSDAGGTPHANYDGASAGSIVEFNGTTWDETVPTTGMFISADDESTLLYYWGGASWSQKAFESTTASTGLTKVGNDVRLAAQAENASGIEVSAAGAITLNDLGAFDSDDLAEGVTNLYHTQERAQDAAGAMATNSTKVSLTYNDGANTLTPDIVAGSLVNADINASAAIDASKIGNGDVSNIELSYLDGVTSAVQTQLNGKANTTLSNLGTTDLQNVDLDGVGSIRPDVDNANILGTGTLGFSRANIRNLRRVDVISVDVHGRNLAGFTGTPVFTWETGLGALIDLDMNANNIIDLADPTADQHAATKKYVDDAVAGAATASAGDISETSFTLAQTQTDQDVTGLAFASGTVRSFLAQVSVLVDATTDLYEVFELRGINKGASWDMSVESTGDNSLVSFDITAAGQVQYSSDTYAGFADTADTVKFRASTTTI